MSPEALHHLRGCDPVLSRVIDRVGPCTLEPEADRSPFESLVRAVAHQQLHGAAAATILRRFTALFPRGRFPSPRALAAVSDEQLRAAGFSRAKVMAIRDIAARTLSGAIPSGRAISRMADEEIIRRLTEARGVGRWTVEMLLIFKLGRPDVLPVDDFGVRNGFRVAYGLGALPRASELRDRGERWRPHRTTAAWYLWRVADAARGGGGG